MGKKKYLFFDIDGTLTDRTTGLIVPSAREAVRKLEEAGHFVSLATGRAFYKAVPFAEKHGFKNMVCNWACERILSICIDVHFNNTIFQSFMYFFFC